jgi:hypothetical protein
MRDLTLDEITDVKGAASQLLHVCYDAALLWGAAGVLLEVVKVGHTALTYQHIGYGFGYGAVTGISYSILTKIFTNPF